MLLSIVIPTHNRCLFLEKLLLSIRKNSTESSDIEIIVIDDASNSAHKQVNALLCKKYHAAYHCIDSHHGPAHARNAGITIAQGKWIAFLDDDVYVSDEWYKNSLQKITQVDDSVAGIEGATYCTGRGLWDKEVENRSGDLYLSCNILYRKKILRMCNGFDEGFTGPYAEDQELAMRVKKWGRIIFDDRIFVLHMPRSMDPLKYLAASFSRMKELLDAEFHFYTKQRHAYHTMRFADTFWKGYIHALLKHVLITIKRRSILSLIKHPFQAFVLLSAACMEQIAAWVYLYHYIFLWQTSHLKHAYDGINKFKTGILWNIKDSFTLSLFQFKPSLLKSFLFRIKRKPAYNALEILNRTRVITNARVSRIFLRIDDLFFENTHAIEALCNSITGRPIPFLAAVTGCDIIHHTHAPLLRTIVDKGGKLGIHGFIHNGTYGPYTSEILQLNYSEIDYVCTTVAQYVNACGFRTVAFVAPFNAIAWDQIVYLSRRFPIITGGPETARFTGNLFGPLVLETGSIYFPSFHPFYGRAADMLDQKFFDTILYTHAPLCITLHLQQEAADAFSSFKKFITLYRAFITDWESLIPEQITQQQQEPVHHEHLVYGRHTS